MLLIQAEKLQSLGQMAASVASRDQESPVQYLHMGIECLEEFLAEGDEQMNVVLQGNERGGASRERGDPGHAGLLERPRTGKAPACPNALVHQTLRFVKYDFTKAKVRVVTSLQEGICQCLSIPRRWSRC